MIIVPIILSSAITGKKSVLGSVVIINDGTGTKKRRNYRVEVYGKKLGLKDMDAGIKVKPIRKGKIKNWASEARPVFELLLEALRCTNYRGLDV